MKVKPKEPKIPFKEIKEFFFSFEIPKDGHKLFTSDGWVVLDPEKTIKSHIDILTANPGNLAYVSYYDRLVEFYKYYKK